MDAFDIHKLFGIYLLVVNLLSVGLYGWDKICAKRDRWRIPEKFLLLTALVGGSVGAMAAMMCFRHKTLHWRFRMGLPTILILQIAAIVYIHVR